MTDLALTRPSDDTVTRRVIAYIRRPWDRALDGRNVLTGEPLPMSPPEQVVAFMNGADIVDEPAPAMPPSSPSVEAALVACGAETVDQLPGYARRLLGLPVPAAHVEHADLCPLRGYGRRGLLNLAWPAKWRRARAANAPHRRIARWALRGGYALVAVAVPTVGLLVGRGA